MKKTISFPTATTGYMALLSFVLLTMTACSYKDDGVLIVAEAVPSRGYNYPYFLYLPAEMDMKNPVFIIAEGNNSGFANDDFQEHKDKAKRTASLDYYLGNYVSRELNYPLLVPVFPRTRSEWKIYSHSLDRDAVLLKNHEMERIDLQLLAMLADATGKLDSMGYKVHDQILMTGFSASGTFANRFTAIHPDKVYAMAAGGVNGLLFLPTPQLDSTSLIYPVGTSDFDQIFGKPFDLEAYKNTPQFLFMGQQDDNDAIPYDDGYDKEERNIIYQVLGQKMQPDRWTRCMELYMNFNVQAEINTYPQTGHEHPESIKNDIVGFFRKHLPQAEKP